MELSYLDMIFIGIIVINGLSGLGRGLIRTVFDLVSTIVSLIAAYLFYPYVAELIKRYTHLYDFFQDKIASGLNLEKLSESVLSKQDQLEFIKCLNMPGILKESLIANNNSEIYRLMDVSTIEEYISGFISSMVINALSFVGIMVAAGIIIAILVSVLELAAKLPVLKEANRLGGLIVGSAFGIIHVWILCLILSIIIGYQGNGQLLGLIETSPIASFFYEKNMLIRFISDITKTIL